MMTRKTLALSVGLAVSIAGGVSASERERETGSVSGDATAAVASPGKTWMVSQDVGAGTRNGQTYQMNVNGAVSTTEVEKAFGSIEHFQFESANISTPRSTHNGVTALANGAVANVEPAVSSQPASVPVLSVAELKQTAAWSEANRGGVNLLVFANGVVLNEMAQVPPAIQHNLSVPSVERDGVRIYADGAAFSDNKAANQGQGQ